MADYLPKFHDGVAITLTASDTVTGGQLVAVTGDGTVGTAGSDSTAVVGVAGFDVESGDRLTVYRHGVQRLTAADAITAGAPVASAADGQVSASGSNHIGVALTAASKKGDVIDVAM